jgi:hypothetical protein
MSSSGNLLFRVALRDEDEGQGRDANVIFDRKHTFSSEYSVLFPYAQTVCVPLLISHPSNDFIVVLIREIVYVEPKKE